MNKRRFHYLIRSGVRGGVAFADAHAFALRVEKRRAKAKAARIARRRNR